MPLTCPRCGRAFAYPSWRARHFERKTDCLPEPATEVRQAHGGAPESPFDRRVREARRLSAYKPGLKIEARDSMARAVGMPEQYTYTLTARAGREFAPDFKPWCSPGEMLRLGVFSGKYLNDCTREFPREWFVGARDKLRPGVAGDKNVNLFGVKSRKSIQYWREKGWIPVAPGDRDARGWFQWYCRYWLGRRMPAVDAAQIKRWKAFVRHAGQIRASYARLPPGKVPKSRKEKREHRAKQRQGLLQWAHDPWV